MNKTLVIGSACADVSMYLDHLPGTEEDVHAYEQRTSLGGCACNAADLLRLFHVPFTLYAPVGKGIYGMFVENELQKRGIPVLLHSDEENGMCLCLIDREGNRTFAAVHGAEYKFRTEWMDALDMSQYDQIYVCGLELEESTGDILLEFLERNAEKKIFFAPGPRILSIPEERMKRMLALHPAVHCNRREASSYVSHPEYTSEESALALYALTGSTVIVTDGGNPCVFVQDGTVYTAETEQVRVTDGTGAGDAHIGTIMAMRAMGKTWMEAVTAANKAGALTASVQGSSIPEKRFREVFANE